MGVALHVNSNDNVATVFINDVTAGTMIPVKDVAGEMLEITVNQAIPYGHKTAINPIKTGEPIIKYGEQIGLATSDIAVGDWVHIHNLESARGRGDWARKEGEEL